MAYDTFTDLPLNAGIASTTWDDGGISYGAVTNWKGDGNGNISAASISSGSHTITNFIAPDNFKGFALFVKVLAVGASVPVIRMVVDGSGALNEYLSPNGAELILGAYGELRLRDLASGASSVVNCALTATASYCVELSKTGNASGKEYAATVFLASGRARGAQVATVTLTIATALPSSNRRFMFFCDMANREQFTISALETVPLTLVVADPPTGTITSQPAPDGQNQRFVGNTTNAVSGVYTLTGSNGGMTVGPSTFTIVANTFDFVATGLEPGTYIPDLTVTGPGGGPAQVSGASPFSIIAVDGGGEIPAPSDTTVPTITAAAVASSAPGVVVLTASEPLDTNFVPAASAFTVTGHTVQSVTVQGSAINLTVTPTFANGEAPRTAAYVQPATNGARDAAGNLLASFSGLAITNNVAAPISTVTGVTINPTTATIAGGATQVFTGAAQGTNNPAQTFNWTRSPAVGSITGNGTNTGTLVGPAATNVPQTITVRATSTQDPNYWAEAVVTIPAASPAGTSFTRSLARTIKVKPAPQMFEGGPFWNTTNKTRPVGTIDKDETIDISFDLTEVLADIADTVKQIDFDLSGLTSVGGYFTGAVATVFVSNAVPVSGGKNPSITCKMTTNSTPSRKEDWTVELKIEEQ